MESKFYCEKCHYKCSKKFCWEQHLSTSKHKNAPNYYEAEVTLSRISDKVIGFEGRPFS